MSANRGRGRPSPSLRAVIRADFGASVGSILILVLGLAAIGGTTGYTPLEGWPLVGAIAFIVLATAVAIAAVSGRRLRMRAKHGDSSTDASLD